MQLFQKRQTSCDCGFGTVETFQYFGNYSHFCCEDPVLALSASLQKACVAVLRASSKRFLTPVSTRENKHRIGSDWTFSSCIIHTARPKKLKILQLFICGSQVQTGTKNWYRKPISGFNFVPIRSDPTFIFLSGNRPLADLNSSSECIFSFPMA